MKLLLFVMMVLLCSCSKDNSDSSDPSVDPTPPLYVSPPSSWAQLNDRSQPGQSQTIHFDQISKINLMSVSEPVPCDANGICPQVARLAPWAAISGTGAIASINMDIPIQVAFSLSLANAEDCLSEAQYAFANNLSFDIQGTATILGQANAENDGDVQPPACDHPMVPVVLYTVDSCTGAWISHPIELTPPHSFPVVPAQ